MTRIKFNSKKDEVDGYYLLSTRGIVKSLPNGLYEINNGLLSVLKISGVHYSIIDEKKILTRNETIRNSLAVSL